jgi:hypothetical protein
MKYAINDFIPEEGGSRLLRNVFFTYKSTWCYNTDIFTTVRTFGNVVKMTTAFTNPVLFPLNQRPYTNQSEISTPLLLAMASPKSCNQ